MIWILALYLDFEGAKNIHVFKSSFGALEDAGGSWLGFSILVLICILSLVFAIPLLKMLALYLDFENGKIIHVF